MIWELGNLGYRGTDEEQLVVRGFFITVGEVNHGVGPYGYFGHHVSHLEMQC